MPLAAASWMARAPVAPPPLVIRSRFPRLRSSFSRACGESVDRQRRRVHGVQPGWAGCRVIRVDQNAFGPEAASPGQRGLVCEHPVAYGEPGDTRADGQHLARALHAQRRRGAQPHVPASAVQQLVPRADPGRLNRHQDLTGPGRWRFGQLQQGDFLLGPGHSARLHSRSLSSHSVRPTGRYGPEIQSRQQCPSRDPCRGRSWCQPHWCRAYAATELDWVMSVSFA